MHWRPSHPAIVRKRGNPKWGRLTLSGIPVLPTEFEMQVRQLGLTPQTYVQSAELRRWCERNCGRCYVPEWLLEAWNITVDADFVVFPPNGH